MGSAASIRSLQATTISPTNCGSSQVEMSERSSSIRKLSENHLAITSKRRLGYIGRMRSARLLLPAVVLAACATAPNVEGQDRQIEVDSHLLLGEIALDRQDFPAAAREFLAANPRYLQVELTVDEDDISS